MSSDDDEEEEKDDHGGDEPPKMHYRTVMNVGGINRVRSCPQQPGVAAVWCDNGQVKVLDGTKLFKELADEAEPSTRYVGVEGHLHAAVPAGASTGDSICI
jgi:ribosome assembly protein RRB1